MIVKNDSVKYSYLLIHDSISHQPITTSRNFQIVDWMLYVSDDMDVNLFESDKDKIILLGYCMDIRDGLKKEDDVLSDLLKSEDIVKELEYINGRYTLIVSVGNSINVYTDTSAMLPTHYASKHKILSSHDELIKEVLEPKVELTPVTDRYEGALDFTRYVDIFKFNPSLTLELNTYTFSRIYPRHQIERIDVNEIVSEFDHYINEMNKWLKNQNNRIILTLTGGFDSRVSMAFTNELAEKVEYITYIHPDVTRLNEAAQKAYAIDEFITNDIAKNMRINHTHVKLADHPLPKEDRPYYLKYIQSRHSFALINYFKNYRDFNKAIHIKSTVYGMGKSDFPLNRPHNVTTVEEMISFVHGVPKMMIESNDYKQIMAEYFNRNIHSINVGKGRHYFDIFHLESRLANWHSNTTQEVDPYIIEFIYMNSRKLIDLIQSPNIQQRKDKLLYKLLIKKYWPTLLYIGFNETSYYLDENKIGLNNVYFNGLDVIDSQNLEFNIEDNILEFKPNTTKVNPSTMYMMQLKNNSNKEQSIRLYSGYSKKTNKVYIDATIHQSDEKSSETIDIADLSQGFDLILKPFRQLTVKINYHHSFGKESWQQAGRIYLKINE